MIRRLDSTRSSPIRGGSRILQRRVSNPSERGTKGAETETPKASRGWGMQRGYLLPSRLGLGDTFAPAENEFGAFPL